MGILRSIRQALFGSPTGEIRDRDGIYLYLRCSQCGAPVRVRIDKGHDLQRDYDTGGFVVHREVMDGTCFALMQATVHLDARLQIVDSTVMGGELISWENYRALTDVTHSPT
jgi:hypothetical protein